MRVRSGVWIAAAVAAALVLVFSHVSGGQSSAHDDRAQALRHIQTGDYDAALDLLTTAARQGDAAALHLMGDLYLHGQGVPQDPRRALRFYRSAEQSGHAPASTAIGLIYHNGLGVPEDRVKAYVQFARAGGAGSSRALRQIRSALTPEQIAEAERQIAGMGLADS
jgi:TPR repeat protein